LIDETEKDRLDGSIGVGFDEYLFYLLTQVHNRRARDFAPALEALGLTIPHWRALSTINRLGGCSMNELAEFTTTDRTTLTRTMDQLVEMGLVERVATPGDRRLVRVELTGKGSGVYDRAVTALVTYNGRVLAGVGEDDMRGLRAPLQRMLKNMISDEALFRQVVNYQR
jgi:DNA-binding MarR family transcriptional regulator